MTGRVMCAMRRERYGDMDFEDRMGPRYVLRTIRGRELLSMRRLRYERENERDVLTDMLLDGMYDDQLIEGPAFGGDDEPPVAEAIPAAPKVEETEEYQSLLNQSRRLKAEFENYKRRAERERDEAKKFANEDLLINFAPLIDDIDRALQAAETSTSTDGIVDGIRIMRDQFMNKLKAAGVEPIGGAGEPFNPEVHEALSMMPSDDVPENHVIQTYQSGFKLNDRLIRAAKVVVSKKG